ncbi:MAG: hypothetical protein AB8C13_01810 [Phycisphaerales bacterium]
MLRMLVRNRIQDYALWRRVFDENLVSLTPSGLTVEWIRRDLDNLHEAWFCLIFEDRTQAEAFVNDPANAEIGERAGVLGGEIIYLGDDSAGVS